MNDVKISIIIPNHNGAKYLNACLDSVYEQTFKDYEIIIVDDESLDESRKIIQTYAEKNAEIKYIFQSQMNASVARNRGMELAKGEYVYFLDSDDILNPQCLTTLYKNANETGADIVIGYFEVFNENETLFIRKDFSRKEVISQVMGCTTFSYNPSNKLYRKAHIEQFHVNWGNVRIGQDMNFFLKYLLHCKTVCLVDEVVFRYRISSTNMSSQYNFRILDIVNSVEDIRNYYVENNSEMLYQEYISGAAFQSFYDQMEKQKYFSKRSERRLIVDYFSFHIKQLGNEMKNVSRKKIIKYRLKVFLKPLYISNFYNRT